MRRRDGGVHEDIGNTEIYAHVDMSDFRKGGGKTPPGLNITMLIFHLPLAIF